MKPARLALALLLIAAFGAGACGKKRSNVTSPYTGAPTTTDSDGDGIPDSNDACPTVAGTTTFNGCPAPGADVCSGASPYTLAPYKWATPTPVYALGSSLPSGWRASVDAGALAWNAAGSRLAITKNPTISSAGNTRDGKNVVSYGPLGSGVLGTTYAWYDTRTRLVTEADIVLSSTASMTVGGSRTSVDVQSVITHEFGHFAGLDHVTDITHTMHASLTANSTIYRTLCDGDELGVKTQYP